MGGYILFSTVRSAREKGRGHYAAIRDAQIYELCFVDIVHEAYLAWALIGQNKLYSTCVQSSTNNTSIVCAPQVCLDSCTAVYNCVHRSTVHLHKLLQ